MQLDDTTLRVVVVLFGLLLGLLLLFSWFNNRINRELLFLGASYAGGALGLGLMGGGARHADPLYVDLGYTVIFFSYGLAWMAMRLFERRPLLAGRAAAGGVVWLVIVTVFNDSGEARVLAVGLIPFIYSMLAALELWRGRGEYLPSRMALFTIICVNSILVVTRRLIDVAALVGMGHASGAEWVPLLTLLSTMGHVAATYLMLSLTKERLEGEQRAQTLIDPLTGLGNRRALNMHAERILRRQAMTGQPVCVAVIDLDHFKQINDTFGHFIGDTVLRVFAERATLKLRPTDHLFRVGGEEFLCILQTAQERDAVGIMERIRRTMKDYRLGEGEAVRDVTISAGVASTQRVGYDLEDLMRAADAALYRAKHEGRNCVRVYTGGDLRSGTTAVLPAVPAGRADPQAT
ncbi:GGDEF domain-containing protein [Pseudochelatococcus sp. B33]